MACLASTLLAVDEPFKGLTGTEWGFIGFLVFSIISAFMLLLRHVLKQAQDDRAMFQNVSGKNIEALEKINVTLSIMQVALNRVQEDLDELRSKRSS